MTTNNPADNSQVTVDANVLKMILVNLVTVPEDVKVDRKIDEQGVILSVMVNAKDMGIVIGRNGSIASTIKTIMRAIGKANKMNIRVQFLEPDGSIKYSADNQNKQNREADQKDEVTTQSSKLDDDLADFVVN